MESLKTDGIGTAFSEGDSDRFEEIWLKHYPVELPVPYIYPMSDGNVSVEWHIPESPSLEIDLKHQIGIWHDMESNMCLEFHLECDEDWWWIINRIKGLT